MSSIQAEKIIEMLDKIKDPQFELSIVELGLIERVSVDDQQIRVFVNFTKSLPHCKSCVPVAWMVLRAVLREMEMVLRETGMRFTIQDSSSDIIYGEG